MRAEQVRRLANLADGSRQPPTVLARKIHYVNQTAQYSALRVSWLRYTVLPGSHRPHRSLVASAGKRPPSDTRTSSAPLAAPNLSDELSEELSEEVWRRQHPGQTREAPTPFGSTAAAARRAAWVAESQQQQPQQQQETLRQWRNRILSSVGRPVDDSHARSTQVHPTAPSTETATSSQTVASDATTAIAAAAAAPFRATSPSPSLTATALTATSKAPGTGPPSPHDRAWSLLSTVVAVLAVGAYVYTLISRRKATSSSGTTSAPQGQRDSNDPTGLAVAAAKGSSSSNIMSSSPSSSSLATDASAAGAAATAAKKRAGSGLFRQPREQKQPPVPAATDTTAAAAATAADGGGTAKTVPAPVTALGPAPAPRREQGWWRRLGRLYYISFGAQYGLVPRVMLGPVGGGGSLSAIGGGGGGAVMCLVAFEDAEDAEYAANLLWEDLVLNGAQSPGPRPASMGVLSAAPLFLEDLAAMRGAPVEVLPSGSLPKDRQLSVTQLQVLLASLLRGATLDAALADLEENWDPQDSATEPPPPSAAAGNPSPAAAGETSADGDRTTSGGGGPPGSGGAAGRSALEALRGAQSLERLAAQRGVKLQMPSKFDFPGFDSAAALSQAPSAGSTTTSPPSQQTAQAAPATAATSASSSIGMGTAATPGAAVMPPVAATSAAAAAKASVNASESKLATPTPPAASEIVPRVVPSVVREHDVDGPWGGRFPPYSGDDDVDGVIDAEATAVVARPPPGAGTTQTDSRRVVPTSAPSAAAASRDQAPAASVTPTPSEPVSYNGSTTESEDAGSAAAIAAAAAADAIREYKEFEMLLSGAVGSRWRDAGTAAGDSADALTAPADTASGKFAKRDTAPSSADNVQPSPWPKEMATAQEERDVSTMPEVNGPQVRQSMQRSTPPPSMTGNDLAREILARKGPTDDALVAAISAMEVGDGRVNEDEDLLQQYYAMFGEPSPKQEAVTTVGTTTKVNSSSGVPSGSSNSTAVADVAAEVSAVQRQLAEVVQAVAMATARGSPPPPDATAAMQRLQQRLADLQTRLGAEAGVATPSPPSPSPAVGVTQTVKPSDGGVTAGRASTAPVAGVSSYTAAAAALVTPLKSSSSSSSSGSSSRGATAATDDSKAGARRAWGAWKVNKRIQAAEASLLKTVGSGGGERTAASSPSISSAPSPSPALSSTGAGARSASKPRMGDAADTDVRSVAAAAGPESSRRGQEGAASDKPNKKDRDAEEDEGVKVLSKRVGTNRPPKVVEAPEARQDRVKEALRVFSEMGGGAGDADEEQEGEEMDELASRQGARQPWWQRRYQALYLPSIGYPDGSMGFMQVNVSLQPDRRDMRVLAFEDRADCTGCLTLISRWPEYEGTDPRLSMMPTGTLLQQLRAMYDEQPDLNGSVSRPRGIVVFRRGKLPIRPGIGPDEFLQLVVYQHAAQVALARTGYDLSNT